MRTRQPSGWTASLPTAARRRRRRRSRRRRNRVSVWAVLAAAGRGERLGSDRPKAFAKLRDRPLLAEGLERREALGGELAGATDCASLVEAHGGRVTTVLGDPRLVKVTDSADLELVAALL